MGTVTYVRNFFKDRYVASLVPTFSWAVKATCAPIDFNRDLFIVEYGAGTGVFTRYLLKHLTPNSKLVAIEQNEGMFKELRRRLTDPRLTLLNDSAENVLSLVGKGSAVDFVISGIPFSLFPSSLSEKIVSDTFTLLKPGGEFLVYQCLRTKKGEANSVLPHLEGQFKGVSKHSILLNIPPLIVYQARR